MKTHYFISFTETSKFSISIHHIPSHTTHLGIGETTFFSVQHRSYLMVFTSWLLTQCIALATCGTTVRRLSRKVTGSCSSAFLRTPLNVMKASTHFNKQTH